MMAEVKELLEVMMRLMSSAEMWLLYEWSATMLLKIVTKLESLVIAVELRSRSRIVGQHSKR
jgi:hypothetical protein